MPSVSFPDWRAVSMADLVTADFSGAFKKNQNAIVEYKNDTPHRSIAIVSSMYRFVTPTDYFTEIAQIASAHMNASVSIMEVRTLSSKVFVKYKLPAMFSLTSNPRDSFGLTLVACNPYSGKESHKIGAGAIRGFCDNGCYFGAHEALSYDHKRRREEEGDDIFSVDARKVTSIIDKAVPLAQTYVDRMIGVKLGKKVGDFRSSRLKAESLLESCAVDQAETVIKMLELTTKQRVDIVQQCHVDDDACTNVYDLWNACTFVATRQVNPGSVHRMMSVINEAFTEGGVVDAIAAETAPINLGRFIAVSARVRK